MVVVDEYGVVVHTFVWNGDVIEGRARIQIIDKIIGMIMGTKMAIQLKLPFRAALPAAPL